MSGDIEFDYAKYQRLRKAYDTAVAEYKDQFTFEGHELVTAYAKYLLEYLGNQFGDKQCASR